MHYSITVTLLRYSTRRSALAAGAVSDRLEYKIALITFKALTTQQPQYLAELIRYYEAPRKLRSRGENILQNSASVLNYSKRAFCHASPTVWNSLPQTVICDLTVTTGTFKNIA